MISRKKKFTHKLMVVVFSLTAWAIAWLFLHVAYWIWRKVILWPLGVCIFSSLQRCLIHPRSPRIPAAPYMLKLLWSAVITGIVCVCRKVMVRRVSTTPAVYMENLGGMKALTTVGGHDVMRGFQLICLHVFCTGEKTEPQRIHLEVSETGIWHRRADMFSQWMKRCLKRGAERCW